MRETIYTEIYSELRLAVYNHLIVKEEHNDADKRLILARRFYDAEELTYNIDEKDLHEYLSGCGDPIKDIFYIGGKDYVQFLIDIIETFNGVLPDKINIPINFYK